MAQFKCKASGNIFTFEYEVDILSMRKHPEYEEVQEQKAKKEVKSKTSEAEKKDTENGD